MNPIDVVSPKVGRVRAYFAPVNRTAKAATIFDPAQSGSFALEAPPTPWTDLGWITNFTRKSATKIDAVRSGAPQATQLQTRSIIDAEVAFSFESWGKLQLALAAGTQQMNVLKAATGATAAGSGGTAISAVPLTTGSTATVLQMSPSDAATFSVGELIAVDVDYTGTTGFVGSGVSGAYVANALTDIDYTRRITLNVARIAAIAAGAVTLSSPLIAGTPTSSMKVSAVIGFCDREGSTFFQEWSALLVAEGQQGERVLWHYPRLQAMTGIAETNSASSGGYETVRLAGTYRALPVTDAVDGQRVVCFRSYMTA